MKMTTLFIPACERDETYNIKHYMTNIVFSFPPASEMKQKKWEDICNERLFSFPPASEMKLLYWVKIAFYRSFHSRLRAR